MPPPLLASTKEWYGSVEVTRQRAPAPPRPVGSGVQTPTLHVCCCSLILYCPGTLQHMCPLVERWALYTRLHTLDTWFTPVSELTAAHCQCLYHQLPHHGRLLPHRLHYRYHQRRHHRLPSRWQQWPVDDLIAMHRQRQPPLLCHCHCPRLLRDPLTPTATRSCCGAAMVARPQRRHCRQSRRCTRATPRSPPAQVTVRHRISPAPPVGRLAARLFRKTKATNGGSCPPGGTACC